MIYQILSKLLPLLILPLGATLILLFLRLFWPRKALLPLAFSILVFFSLGNVSRYLSRLIERPWVRLPASSAPQADAIVVLSGGGIHLRGRQRVIEWTDPDRFFAGIELFKARKAKRLLFTGEINAGDITSGDLYMLKAKEFGIPQKAMATTSLVFNTKDEAREIRKILDIQNTQKSHRILLVTSAFHMNRAKHTFEKEGLVVFPFPVDFKTSRGNKNMLNPYRWIPSSTSLRESSIALREIIGRLVYRLK